MRIQWLFVLLLLPGLAGAADFTTWRVPWEKTRPRDPAVDAQGQVWFVGQGGDYVASLDAASGEFTRIELPEGAGPHNLIVDESGDLWIAGNRAGWIGRMNPANGDLRKIATAERDVDDPHTLIQGKDGRVWFTAQQSNRIGVLDPADESLQVWEVPTPRARPYGIVLDENDQPWIVLLGTNRLATVEGGKLREIEMPRDDARPRRLDVVDGNVWYVDYAEAYVGRYDPQKNEFREWLSPSGEDAAPYGAIADDDGNFFYVETGPQPNRMIGIDTGTGEFIYNKEIPDSGGAVRHMFHDAKRDAIWFGMDTNYIGRFDPPDE
ncbi:MAG TPA: lyase [Gammaproteobacteria bacterium]